MVSFVVYTLKLHTLLNNVPSTEDKTDGVEDVSAF